MPTKATPCNCPFCDSDKVYPERVHPDRSGFAVVCSQCHAQGPFVPMDSEAMNKRGATWESVTEPLREEAVLKWNISECQDVGW